jgi:hypothetical protein
MDLKDYRNKKAIEIEEMDLNVVDDDRKAFDVTLEKYISKYDPENKLSISECIKNMPTIEVRNLFDELLKFHYED